MAYCMNYMKSSLTREEGISNYSKEMMFDRMQDVFVVSRLLIDLDCNPFVLQISVLKS